jgi:Tfp pilus assembly protein PilE
MEEAPIDLGKHSILYSSFSSTLTKLDKVHCNEVKANLTKNHQSDEKFKLTQQESENQRRQRPNVV